MLTPANMSPVCKAYYDMMLLDHLNGQFMHAQFADPARVITLPNGRYSCEWRKWNKLPLATTPVQPGVVPAPSTTSVDTVTATPNQYINWVPFTDQVDMTSIDPVIENLVDLCSINAAETLDTVFADTLSTTGSNVQYANGKLSRGALTVLDVVTTEEIDKAVRTLERNKVPKFADAFGGSYIAFVHPDVKFDIRKDDDWKKVDEYAGGVKTYDGELGRWNGVRLIVNALAKKFPGAGSGGVDVYSTLIFGRFFYGMVKWGDKTGGVSKTVEGGQMVEIFVKPLGSAGANDPANQFGTVAWKASAILKIINQACGVRLESGATS